ncbi:Major facilitator superfamily (MFS) profile domain-containing protein [[Candida] zeylanoides]
MPHQPLKESVLVGRALLNFTSVFVSLGVFLFGFEQGLMSSLLTNEYFKQYYRDPSPAAVGTMIAILEIGALASSFYAGKVGDSIGRRRTIRYGSAIFVVGGLVQTFSVNIVNLSVGRLISGVAIGFLTTIIPCYQSEISPPDDRGFYACLEFTGNIIGYSTSIWTDYGFSFLESDFSWRVPLSLQCVVGAALLCGSFVIVETPRWLLDHDHDHEGMIVIADLYADGDVERESGRNQYRQIKESVLLGRIEGGERSYRYMFQRYKKRLSVACFSQMFAQLNGINIVSYYAPMIFESAGWAGRSAILMTGINSLVYVGSTIPPWYLVDGWGRKPLLLTGAVFMGLPLLAISYSLHLDNEYTARVVVGCVIVFNAAFGASWGPIPWMMNEVIPNSVRSKGAAASTATNWLFNFLVGELTPILLDRIKWKTYLIPAASCALSFLCVHFLFPETKGLTLEDMGSVFDDSSSIFSFHSSLNAGYGATEEAAPPRRTSVSVEPVNDAFRQSHASVARNTALVRPDAHLDGIITGSAPPPKPKSDVESLDGLGPTASNVPPPQEIEPPSYESLVEFKLAEQRKPGALKQLWHSVRGAGSPKTSEDAERLIT